MCNATTLHLDFWNVMEIDFFFRVAIKVPSTCLFRLYGTGNQFYGGKDNEDIAGTAWLQSRVANRNSISVFRYRVKNSEIKGSHIRIARVAFRAESQVGGSHGKRNFRLTDSCEVIGARRKKLGVIWTPVDCRKRLRETITVDFAKTAIYRRFRHILTRKDRRL